MENLISYQLFNEMITTKNIKIVRLYQNGQHNIFKLYKESKIFDVFVIYNDNSVEINVSNRLDYIRIKQKPIKELQIDIEICLFKDGYTTNEWYECIINEINVFF